MNMIIYVTITEFYFLASLNIIVRSTNINRICVALYVLINYSKKDEIAMTLHCRVLDVFLPPS